MGAMRTQVMGGIGIAVYLVGFPLMVVLALRHIKRNSLFCDKDVSHSLHACTCILCCAVLRCAALHCTVLRRAALA